MLAKLTEMFFFKLLSLFSFSSAFNLDRTIFVINSQSNSFHATTAKQTKNTLEQDLRSLGVQEPRVLLTHLDQEIPEFGAWTYLPTIEHISLNYGKEIDWAIFLEENANVKLPVLSQVLMDKTPEKEVFVGHALEDSERVWIHNFDEPGLKYPHATAGFVMSSKLMNTVRKRLKILRSKTDFPRVITRDAHYELAKTIGHVELIHDERFCRTKTEDDGCAIHPRDVSCDATLDDVIRLAKATLFAVKTCKKFHSIRLPIGKDTWHTSALNIRYFSEEEDPEFGTTVLPGVANTEKGHCNKSDSIVTFFRDNAAINGWRWIVIVDDDTVLSVVKLLDLLKCYDGKDASKAVALGEVYGNMVVSGSDGFDYQTGGGGMVFNLVAAEMLEHCRCPRNDFEDDFHFGMCLSNLAVPIVRVPRFHQSRPKDYHESLLESQDPISFHSFHSSDPRVTYDRYFREADDLLRDFVRNTLVRQEL